MKCGQRWRRLVNFRRVGCAQCHHVGEFKVPNEYGVYIVTSLMPLQSEVVYVGKAGSMNFDGQWKRQDLSQRIANKQGNQNRNKFFRDYISEEQFIGLHFEWFVTFDNESSKVLPY